jgi:hypothetical protein
MCSTESQTISENGIALTNTMEMPLTADSKIGRIVRTIA